MSRALVLLSGEGTGIPVAEAKALFLAYDPASKFSSPEPRILIAESDADPRLVERRIAFARRVGVLLRAASDASEVLRGKRVRLRVFRNAAHKAEVDVEEVLGGLDLAVDLENPDYELTVVVGGETRYLALTTPQRMKQGWHIRRPRRRAFFHPSAIFPKLSRALVNLTRCTEGQILLDPFAGTGSILIEAAEVGIAALAADQTDAMTRGSKANMEKLGQSWLGVIRADAFSPPLRGVDGIATDAPYGRASSTRGRKATSVVEKALETFPSILKSGSRLVMMHPSQVPVDPPPELIIEEAHSLYVHKLLTRTITVLRRS